MSELDETSLLDKWDPLGEHWNSTFNSLAVDPTSDPHVALTGYSSKPAHDYCHFFAVHGHCMDGEHCTKRQIKGNNRERFVDREQVFCVSQIQNPFFEFKAGARFLVQVTYLETPSKFHVIFPYKNKDFQSMESHIINSYIETVQQSPAMELISCMNSELGRLYDIKGRVDNVNIEINISELVCVKLKSYNNYYRAVVVDKDYMDELEVDIYDVRLMDIGGIHRVRREQIYPLPQRLLLEPTLSFDCRLPVRSLKMQKDDGSSGNVYDWKTQHHPDNNIPVVEPVGVDPNTVNNPSGWSDEAVEFCKNFTKSKFLLASILGYDSQNEWVTIDLIDAETSASLSNELLNKCLALGTNQ